MQLEANGPHVTCNAITLEHSSSSLTFYKAITCLKPILRGIAEFY